MITWHQPVSNYPWSSSAATLWCCLQPFLLSSPHIYPFCQSLLSTFIHFILCFSHLPFSPLPLTFPPFIYQSSLALFLSFPPLFLPPSALDWCGLIQILSRPSSPLLPCSPAPRALAQSVNRIVKVRVGFRSRVTAKTMISFDVLQRFYIPARG